MEINSFFKNLVNGSFENKQLLEDFLLYGKENFQFFVLDCDLEFGNGRKLAKRVDYYKNLYSGDLY